MSVTRAAEIQAPRLPREPSTDGHRMPSGRTVIVDTKSEEVRIVGVNGELEVRVLLTEDGPVLTMRSARLALEAQDTVAVRCREFRVDATDAVRLSTDGEVHLKSTSDTHIDADHVQLNCGDRTGYHDDPAND